jgi:asparagine synthase (glutamine-hydrolysing)
MCGIAGQSRFDGRDATPASAATVLSRLEHRGPDGQGQWTSSDREVWLGHTRLAIIDRDGGAQPMSNEDASVWVVFNGEIYNHVELRRELEARGHRFHSHSDTEVLVHLYEEHGEDMLPRLNGMFALAIWDDRARRLLLARDRMGKKPLYHTYHHGVLSFASELKGLWPMVDGPAKWDPAAMDDYLTFQYVPSPRTAFAGISKLPAGHWLTFSAAGIRQECYWRPPLPRPTYRGTFDDAAIELRELLRDATRIRLHSDVPLGALLSGGVDSSTVVGLMSECGAGTVRTFTAGFRESDYDERSAARQVAQHFGTRHEELEVVPADTERIRRCAQQFDEPFADSSAIPTAEICRLAREHVTVVLTGDGGDESLLGYPRYRQLQQYAQQRQWMRPLMVGSGLHAFATWLCPRPGRRTWRRRLRTLATRWDSSPAAAYERWLAIFSGEAKGRLRTPDFAAALDSPGAAQERIRAGLSELHVESWPAAAAAFDQATYLCEDILTKVDRASMAHGLECRSPLLDYRVVEFLATLPPDWKLHPQHGAKWILRAACRDLLPDFIGQRPKMGFAVPLGDWFGGAWSHALEEFSLPRGDLAQWLDAEVVQEWIDEHRAGAVDHRYRLWALTCWNWIADLRPASIA